MKFLQNFFNALFKSLYDVRWLKGQRHECKKAWTFFFTFMLLIVFIQGIIMFWTLPKEAQSIWEKVRVEIPEFEAVLTDGEFVVSGLEQPYVYEYEEEDESFFIYVDTVATDTVDVGKIFESAGGPGVIFTRDTFIVKEDNQTRSFNLNENRDQEGPIEFSRNSIVKWMDTFIQKWFPFLIPAAMFFMIIFWSAAKIIFLVFLSLLAWVISMFTKEKWAYKEILSVGLFAITLPTVLNMALGSNSIQISYLYSIVFLILMSAVFFAKNDTEKETKELE